MDHASLNLFRGAAAMAQMSQLALNTHIWQPFNQLLTISGQIGAAQ
jgi:hypothetical protein